MTRRYAGETVGAAVQTEKKAVRVLFGAILAALVLAALLAPLADGLVKLVPDDGFYYLEIARRLAIGQGSTFDGIHPTNGYHPLWLAVLVPIGWIAEVSRVGGVRVALLVGVGLMGGAILLVQRTASRLAYEESSLATVWLACTLLVASVYGMEAPLAAFLAALLWWRISSGWPSTVGAGAALGALGAALILARLDAGFVVVGANLVWFLRERERRASWAPLLAALLVEVVIGVAYLALNEAAFGAILPVSALLKAARRTGPNLLWFSSLLAWLAVLSLVCGALAAAVVDRVPGRDALYSAALGTGLDLAVLALGGGRETYNWYFTLPVLASGLFVPVLAQFLGRRGWTVARHAVWGAALLLLAIAVSGKTRTTGFAEKIDRAQWLAVHAPPDAVFAEGDCGILGYVSERSFVNVDGLTNSPQFADEVDAGTVDEWLLRDGVNAIALPTSGDRRGVAAIKVRARQRVTLEATLVPWTPAVADARYTLWRIVDLVPSG